MTSPILSFEPQLDPAQMLAALARTAAPLDAASTLPGVVYTEASILACERHALFGRMWLAAAREEDLPEPGSFVTLEVSGERIFIVRGEDARLRAFFNVCRHRGSRLIDEERGRLRGVIACPYHAWTYGLDGRFRRAPRSELQSQEDALGLVALPLALRDGFVYVALDRDAPPLAVQLADLPEFAPYRLHMLKRARRMEYEVAANWKIVCENYSECYHCPLVHPQLNRIADLNAGGFETGACYNGGPMQLRPGYTTLSMSGTGGGKLLRDDGSGESGLVHYYIVYPNLMLGLHPDYLLTHTVWPLAPGRSRVVCELYFRPESLADAAFDASGAIEFWDLTNRQDWALCERVQQGSASRGYVPGPYHASERCVHAFDRWYARWLISQYSNSGG